MYDNDDDDNDDNNDNIPIGFDYKYKMHFFCITTLQDLRVFLEVDE
jgi:hypothetical protein